MRLAMYGGTFNPIHLGHMNAAQAVVDGLQLDKLLLMPANVPPHKALPEGSASPAQRLEMCRLIRHCPRARHHPPSGWKCAAWRQVSWNG